MKTKETILCLKGQGCSGLPLFFYKNPRSATRQGKSELFREFLQEQDC